MLIYKILVPIIKKNIALFGDVIQINSRLDKPAQILSLGQRVKYDIAASVVHSPEIFFLDEPTISLDIKLNPLSTIWFASEIVKRRWLFFSRRMMLMTVTPSAIL